MAKRIARSAGKCSPLHEALAAWHDDRAAHFRGTFDGAARVNTERAELCRTGVDIDVDATEMCGALYLAGDPAWRSWQHRSGTSTADPAAYWHLDTRGNLTGPYQDGA